MPFEDFFGKENKLLSQTMFKVLWELPIQPTLMLYMEVCAACVWSFLTSHIMLFSNQSEFEDLDLNLELHSLVFLSGPEICTFRCLNYSLLIFYPRKQHIMFSVNLLIIKTFFRDYIYEVSYKSLSAESFFRSATIKWRKAVRCTVWEGQSAKSTMHREVSLWLVIVGKLLFMLH